MNELMHFHEQNQPQMEIKQATVHIAIEQISRQSIKKRGKTQSNSIIRLAESIKKYGILTPIEVKPTANSDGFLFYEVIDGNKRLQAAETIGLQQIPCQILSPSMPKYAKSNAINHLKQAKMHYFDQAKALFELTNRYQMTQEEIASRLGYSQSAVANKLRLLHFSEEEQTYIRQLSLTERHARVLLRLKSPEKRAFLAQKIATEGLTVAKSEELVQNIEQLNGSGAELISSKVTQIEPKYQHITTKEGVQPKKFALRDLTPLYNSIERVLGIFQKTGVTVGYCKEEHEDCVEIFIRIPKPNDNSRFT